MTAPIKRKSEKKEQGAKKITFFFSIFVCSGFEFNYFGFLWQFSLSVFILKLHIIFFPLLAHSIDRRCYQFKMGKGKGKEIETAFVFCPSLFSSLSLEGPISFTSLRIMTIHIFYIIL